MSLGRNSTTSGAWRTWKNSKASQSVIAPFQAKTRESSIIVTSAAFTEALCITTLLFEEQIDYSSQGHPFFN